MLYQLEQEMKTAQGPLRDNATALSQMPELSIRGDAVLVDFITRDREKLVTQLEALDVEVTGAFGNMVSAWLPLSKLAEVEAIPDFQMAMPSLKKRMSVW